MKLYIFCMFSCVFSCASGLELPDYIKKCSMSDPLLNPCIKENANLAIPEVVKGIPSFGVPILSPLHLPVYQMDGKDVKLKLKDFDLHGFENLRVTDVIFAFREKKSIFSMAVPYLNITADYMIVDDNVFTDSNYGGGKLHMSLVDNQMKAVCDFVTPVRDGELYIIIDKLVMRLKTQRTDYRFDNIMRNGEGNDKEFVAKHTKIMEGQLQPAVLKLVTDTFRAVVTSISSKAPANEIFLP